MRLKIIRATRTPVVSTAAVAANTIALVGTNTETDIAPAGWGSTGMFGSLWKSFSGGAYVPGYSTHGCYAMPSCGGHNVGYDMVDAPVFDLADYTWKLLANTAGAGYPAAGTGFTTDSGAPWHEVPAGLEVALPSHTYKQLVGIGDSVYKPFDVFGCFDGNGGGERSHKCQLLSSTCAWSRASTNDAFTANAAFAGSSIDHIQSFYDSSRNRLWVFSTLSHSVNTALWLDLSTGAWSGTTITSTTTNFNGDGFFIHDDTLDCVFLIAPAVDTVFRVDLSGSPLTGWTEVSSSGASAIPNSVTRWDRYPAADGGDGCFYTRYNEDTTRLVRKFDPSTRAFSTVTVSGGDTFPTHPTVDNWTGHYTRNFWVSAAGRKCFAWIAGNNQQTALWRP